MRLKAVYLWQIAIVQWLRDNLGMIARSGTLKPWRRKFSR